MEKMLVVVFEDEKKAYEGSQALYDLDQEGNISIHAESVISKDSDGRINVRQATGDFPIRALGGTALGSLVGLLGGPVGLGIGAAAGACAGFVADLHIAGVDGEFLDDVSRALKPGRSAVVADVSEEWVTPVDTRMEALGGVVYRAARADVRDEQISRERAAMQAELAALKAEHAKAKADRKQHLRAMVDKLDSKLQAKVQREQKQREEHKREMDAKVHAIQERAAKAKGEAKAALEARIAELRREFEVQKAKHATAGTTGSSH